jgi:hypothetical protein
MSMIPMQINNHIDWNQSNIPLFNENKGFFEGKYENYTVPEYIILKWQERKYKHNNTYTQSVKELLDTFPQGRSIMLVYKSTEAKLLKEIVDSIKPVLTSYSSEDQKIRHYLESAEKVRLTNKIQCLESEIRYIKSIGSKTEAKQIDISTIKQIPIYDILGISKERSYNKHILCPIRHEKTASFKIYNNNSWYCFGCSEGGDVIDLYMKINNCDFKTAIKRLSA